MLLLQGKIIGFFVAQYVEELEFWVPVMRLREEGAKVVTIGLSRQTIRGYHGLEITPEISIDEVEDAGPFDGLVIPGGFAPDFLRRNQKLLQLVYEVYAQGNIVGSICHGGWVPISAGIVRGHRATGTTAIKDDIENAGGIWVDIPALRDGNLVWGRGVDDLPSFCRELIEALGKQGDKHDPSNGHR
jgi:protease I